MAQIRLNLRPLKVVVLHASEKRKNTLTTTAATAPTSHFDPAFSNANAADYLLLLELDDHTLRACRFNKTKNLVTGFAAYTLADGSLEGAINTVLNEHPALRSEFDQCVVAVRTANYALVPKLAAADDAQKLFTLTNTFDADTDILLEHHLVGERATVLYAVGGETERVLKSAFMHCKLVPHIAPRIEEQLEKLKNSAGKNAVVAHVSGEHVDIQTYRDGKLHMANSFFQTGKEDVAYYILYTSEVLDIDPESTPLWLSGHITPADECWKMLSGYWKNIALAMPSDRTRISPAIGSYAHAQFDHLTHLLLCAS